MQFSHAQKSRFYRGLIDWLQGAANRRPPSSEGGERAGARSTLFRSKNLSFFAADAMSSFRSAHPEDRLSLALRSLGRAEIPLGRVGGDTQHAFMPLRFCLVQHPACSALPFSRTFT